ARRQQDRGLGAQLFLSIVGRCYPVKRRLSTQAQGNVRRMPRGAPSGRHGGMKPVTAPASGKPALPQGQGRML
ncbi:MAG: hypothetical protein Q7K03_04190, partial [Dehalococcoidia bacterium]|nr:hypothetical protein [Dehalococcoidia bacterium]